MSSPAESSAHLYALGELPPYWRGFALFVIRESGLAMMDAIRSWMWKQGFDVLVDRAIDRAAAEAVASLESENKSGAASFCADRGAPAWILAVYDCFPQEPREEDLKQNPRSDNARGMHIARLIRSLGIKNRAPADCVDTVLETECAAQAVEYARLLLPNVFAEIESKVRTTYEAVVPPYPVVRNLSRNARRARILLIDFHGKEAVCKIFRPSRERYFRRELLAREIGAGLPEVSPVLEQGANYLITPFYSRMLMGEGRLFPLFHRNKFIPIWAVKRLRAVILHFRRLGYELIDFAPGAMFVDGKRGIRIVDFEFLQFVAVKDSNNLKGCFAWYPMPEGFTGDVPLHSALLADPYGTYWLSRIGLPRFACARNLPAAALFVLQAIFGLHLSYVRLYSAIAERGRRLKRGSTHFPKGQS